MSVYRSFSRSSRLLCNPSYTFAGGRSGIRCVASAHFLDRRDCLYASAEVISQVAFDSFGERFIRVLPYVGSSLSPSPSFYYRVNAQSTSLEYSLDYEYFLDHYRHVPTARAVGCFSGSLFSDHHGVYFHRSLRRGGFWYVDSDFVRYDYNHPGRIDNRIQLDFSGVSFPSGVPSLLPSQPEDDFRLYVVEDLFPLEDLTSSEEPKVSQVRASWSPHNAFGKYSIF